MINFNLPEDRVAAVIAKSILDQLFSVSAYAGLSEEEREAIALTTEQICIKYYLYGYYRGRGGGGKALGQWYKGCWIGVGNGERVETP
jgi:hypothetical protein